MHHHDKNSKSMKKIKTLNEEMNRMKSLFGDDRLYGNLVELDTITLSGSKTLLNEQWGRLFSKLDDLKLPKGKFWSGTLKGFDAFADFEKRFAKMLNTEISGIDDLIKHFDEYNDIWKVALGNAGDLAKVKRSLQRVKALMSDGDKWKNFPEERFFPYKRADESSSPGILAAFPDRGGMRQMIYNSWLSANGRNLPAVKSTGDITVVKFSDDGKLMVGTKNSENGMVTYKDPESGKVTIIEPDPNFKGKNDLDGKKVDDIEDAIIVDEVPAGSPLKDLDGKTVKGTKENMENLSESIGEKMKETGEKDGIFIFSKTTETKVEVDTGGKPLTKDQQDQVLGMLDDNELASTGGKKTTSGDEAAEEIADSATDASGKPVTESKRKKIYKFFQKKFSSLAWGTRWFWNPLAIQEARLARLWGKDLKWAKDANSFWNRKGGAVTYRLIFATPPTVGVISPAFSETDKLWDTEDLSNNFIANGYRRTLGAIPRAGLWLYNNYHDPLSNMIEDQIADMFGISLTDMHSRMDLKLQQKLKPENINTVNGIQCGNLCGKCGPKDTYSKDIIKKEAKLLLMEGTQELYDPNLEKDNAEILAAMEAVDKNRYTRMINKYINEKVKAAAENEDYREAMAGLVAICKEKAKAAGAGGDGSYDVESYEVNVEGGYE